MKKKLMGTLGNEIRGGVVLLTTYLQVHIENLKVNKRMNFSVSIDYL